MTLLTAGKVNYRARIERAEVVAQRCPFAQEILAFYQQLARFQKDFYEQLPGLLGKHAVAPAGGTLPAELNSTILLKPFDRFLTLMKNQSPAPLAAHSRQLRSRGAAAWENLLRDFWKSGRLQAIPAEPMNELLARAFLQPYAEFQVSALLPPALPMTVCRCPRCDSLPVVGLLRPEGDGGKRFLQCSFCSQEWEFRRILCAQCGEQQEQKLPVYVAEQFPHVRVECCDTCKHYLRTIDCTKDGNAVAVVDDLAAIPLSLWAQENGYSRIHSNLLGT